MDHKIILRALQSEMRNQNSLNIDMVTTLELCQIINKEDRSVATSIAPCLPIIAQAIDALAKTVKDGGRVFYVGAGTSGRLGVLDASELPPTYSADSQQFVAIIAGGDKALRKAQEGAEDDVTAAVTDLKDLDLDGSRDAIIGIAASGRTPYVLSCLEYARSIGCLTVAVSCCSPSEMSKAGNADYMIEAVTGAEVITGSTRMKAGSATKMILNMLSTGIMVRLGKTYGNIMIDVRATNKKLEQRARNIIREVCGKEAPSDDEQIDALLKDCKGSVKLAVAGILLHKCIPAAAISLQDASGNLALALNNITPFSNIIEEKPSASSATQRYVLCLDGGGSKSAATILDIHHNVGIGISGGCNISDGELDHAIANIIAAVQIAMQAFPALKGRSPHQVDFSEILIGLAGSDRQPIANRLYNKLQSQFRIKSGGHFQICTDVELVATVAGQRTNTDHVLVLIAGTGSVAMAYRRDGKSFQRTCRRGGWGALLGDDGSGFDIGKKGIRHALAMIEAGPGQLANGGYHDKYDHLTAAIINHFQNSQTDLPSCSLLNSIISPTGTNGTSNTKKRIADAARVVLELNAVDKVANLIVKQAIADLARLVQSIVDSKLVKLSRTTLAVTGGLTSSNVFREELLRGLEDAGMNFSQVLHVQNPSQEGAELLNERCQLPAI